MTDQPTDFNRLVEKRIRFRDKLAELNKLHKENLKPFQELAEKLDNVLIAHMDSQSITSMKTEAGTIYPVERWTASAEDAEAFQAHVLERREYELMDVKPNVTACRDYLADHGMLPPGVKTSVFRTLGLRRA